MLGTNKYFVSCALIALFIIVISCSLSACESSNTAHLTRTFNVLNPIPDNFGKVSSAPVGGSSNAVDDLTITSVSNGYSLDWTYHNVGDYNQDGTVNVQDITPLAQHYMENTTPDNEWIDGSGNGKVDISDVTPIAMYFGSECAGYNVRQCPTVDGYYSLLGSIQLLEAIGDQRKRFSTSSSDLQEGNWVIVTPIDSWNGEGINGQPALVPPALPNPNYGETEDNDNISQADMLTFPVISLKGNVGDTGYDGDTDDYFTFSCADKLLLSLSLDYDNSSADVIVYLLDASGTTIHIEDTGVPPRNFTWGLTAGTYYLRIRAWSGSSDYTLSAALASPGYSETEDNDATSTANELSLPVASFKGHVGEFGYNGDDNDYFKFTCTDKQLLSISMNYDNSAADLLLYLLDASGSIIYTAQTGLPPRGFAWGLTAGTYYLRIRAWSGSSDYTLDASLSSPGYDETENNDASSDANTLLFPVIDFKGHVGEFGYNGDNNDYLVFSCVDKQLLYISLTYSNATSDVYIYILDQAGGTVYYDWLSNSGYKQFTWGFKSGTYFLRVRAASGYSDYSLDASLSYPGYDETEDNDATSDANLVAVPLAGFMGHVGEFGYDGDNNDYLRFDLLSPNTITLTCSYDNSSGDVGLRLLDNLGSVIASDYISSNNPRIISESLTAATYYIRINSISGDSNYSLNIAP